LTRSEARDNRINRLRVYDAPCIVQKRGYKPATTHVPTVMDLTITVEVPENVEQDAKQEASAGDGKLEDHITDRLRWEWQTS
jgi:hypothetical protein